MTVEQVKGNVVGRKLAGIRSKFARVDTYLRHVDQFSPKCEVSVSKKYIGPQGFGDRNLYETTLTIKNRTTCGDLEFESTGKDEAAEHIIAILYSDLLPNLHGAINAVQCGDRDTAMHYLLEMAREIKGN